MTSAECCCFMARYRLPRQRIITRHGRRGHAPRDEQQPNLMSIMPREQFGESEEIELKCYKISDSCLLVDKDKRFDLASAQDGLTRMRTLESFEEGRRHLDSRLPETMCLIKLRIDPQSGSIERRQLSTHEIGQDNEFENDDDDEHDCTPSAKEERPQRRLKHELRVAEKLSNRSFVLIERAEEQPFEAAKSLASGGGGGGLSNDKMPPDEELDLEREFTSYVSINVATPIKSCANSQEATLKQQQVASKNKKRLKLNLARRLYKFMSSSLGASSSNEASSESTALVRHTEDSGGALVALGREESVGLWPEQLSEAYSLATGAPTTTAFNGKGRDSPSVMISYNHTEAKAYAIALHAELEAQGVRAYLDLYQIKKGDDWQDSLNFAILDCLVFVALITPSYGETLWTSRECKLADLLAKRIIPINFGQPWPPAGLAIHFATLQYINWLHQLEEPDLTVQASSKWPSECVRAIANQIKRTVETEASLSLTREQQHSLQQQQQSQGGPKQTAGVHLSDSSAYESPVQRLEQRRPRPMERKKSCNKNKKHLRLESAKLTDKPGQELRCSCTSPLAHSASTSENSSSGSYGSVGVQNARLARGAIDVRPPSTEAPGGAQSDGLEPINGRAEHLAADVARAAPVGKKASSRRCKKSLGHRTKKVLSRFRRSFGSVGCAPS